MPTADMIIENARVLTVDPQMPRAEAVAVWSTNRSGQVRIDPALGTLQPTLTTVFALRDQPVVHLVTNLLGRTRSCTPQGRWRDLPPC